MTGLHSDNSRCLCARSRRMLRSELPLLFAVCLLVAASPLARPAPLPPSMDPPPSALPDAPLPPAPPRPSKPAINACIVRDAGANITAIGIYSAIQAARLAAESTGAPPSRISEPCPLFVPIINWYARFLDGPRVKPLTPKEKAWLAIRNFADPFNAITILGQSAIAVGTDSHSPYGPGMAGFARNVGVSYTQDLTGEFFGTFLIPSIAHQDPHYHRMPDASIKRRIFHCITQVVWTQGDNGRGMINYADLVGFAIDAEISNLYVPGEETSLPSTAARYSIGLATAPTDNFITEFLPDIARRIHIRVVLVQRIIDQVAKTNGAGGS